MWLTAPVAPESPIDSPSPESSPTRAYRRLRAVLSFVVHRFFRRIEVVGAERVPDDRGGILVAWHPNGLVDPGLILGTFPRQVVFGARSGLFRFPGLGALMRSLGTVPIFRSSDPGVESPEERRRRNARSLDALAEELAKGRFSALFPEGFSHDAPFLHELKTGAARLYYRARMKTPESRPPPAVIPVGLHYDQKRLFRSKALVVYHPPLELPPELDVTPTEEGGFERIRELGRGLTRHIEAELRSAILETESWELHELLHRARKLVRAERAHRAGAAPGATTMDEKVVGMSRVWRGYRERSETHPEELSELRRRVHRYDARLRALGLEDHELDRPPSVGALEAWPALLASLILVFVVLPPFLLAGWLVNLPTAALVWAQAHALGSEEKDVASLKVLGGLVLFPTTWAGWGWLAASNLEEIRSAAPWLPDSAPIVGLTAAALGIVGAVVMLRWTSLALSAIRAVRVRWTRRMRTEAVEDLRTERSALCDEIEALAQGLDLPGRVSPDGRVARGS